MTVHAPDHLGGAGRRLYRRLDALVPLPGVNVRHPDIAVTMDYFGNTAAPAPCRHRGMAHICAEHLTPVAGRCDGCWQLHRHRHHDGAEPLWVAKAVLGDTGATAHIHVWQ